MAKFRDATGRVVMRSTKKTAHRDALKIALMWEDATIAARRGELTQAASVKILRDLMEQTTRETLKVPSIRETLDNYLSACTATGGAASTVIRYRPFFNRFLAHIGEMRARASVASASVAEIESWRNAELASGMSGKSANMGLGILRAAFNAAKRRGEILHNPCDAIANVAARSDEREPFSDAEVVRLLEASKDSEWQGAILVGAWTGLRLADVANLTWGQVDLDAGVLTVTPAKTDKPIRQPMATELRAYLTTLPSGLGKRPLFPTLCGRITGREGGLSNEFGRLMERAGIVVPRGREKRGRGRQVRTKSFHSLRHTFVSRLANADVSADVRKVLAGHDTDEAHARYTHLAFTKQTDALAKLAAIGGWR
ncbi:MAG TPA: tyrosine-type recombinase/integrase [Candidatus Paceibacterota bacterium]|nr:tyrosine-type recombinase/integrase [Candidatus Paceibacterota bacterium]